MNTGTWYAILAYVMWGLTPAYWKWLHNVPATQLICHRIIWSCIVLSCISLIYYNSKKFWQLVLTTQLILIYLVASFLIAINWLVYVWAVNAGFIIETSLGYFINPLISVLLGVIFFNENLRKWQCISLVIAAVSVIYLTITYGYFPWIALTLAITFSIYSLIKKTAPLGSIYGLIIETGILFLPALFYLIYSESIGKGIVFHSNIISNIMIIGSGVVTIVPLIMFVYAVQKIPLSLVGILQYIAPTMQFLIGLLVYREPFTYHQFIGFVFIWIALFIYGIEGFFANRTEKLFVKS
ncbi:MAG: EamA family transporter RarD [Desulfobacterales bacterium]|nr:EamA family transporter RarD [Desulfobacterales bacterium]